MAPEPASHFRPAGFFVARTPLLTATEPVGLQPVDCLEDPLVREAIRLASPSLFDQATRHGRDPQRAQCALQRYIIRMRSRPTPFSLMAGYAWGRVGGSLNELTLGTRDAWTRHVRLAVDCVAKIVDASLTSTARRRATRWRARRDLLILDDVIRMIGLDAAQNNELVYADVQRSPALDAALRSAHRPIPFEAIVSSVRAFAPTSEEAEHYVDSLIVRKLLIPEFYPSVSNEDEVKPLLDIAPAVAAAAYRVRTTSVSVDIDADLSALRASITAAKGECGDDDVIVDVVKSVSVGGIGDDVVRELQELIGVLQRVAARPTDRRLDDFIQHFGNRYEAREVSLVEALDPNRGYEFPVEASFETTDRDYNERFEWLLRVFERATGQGSREVVLTEHDLPGRIQWRPADVFAVTFRLAQDPLSIHEPKITGTPGTALFARATAFMPDLRDAARTVLHSAFSAKSSDAVEVVHFLAADYATYGQLPRLLPRSLTLNQFAPEADDSLEVSDILISVADGRIVLRSRETGRFVRPRIATAVVLDRLTNSSVGRFLGALARVDGPIEWTWDRFGSATFCPRIRYKDHVLCPARWVLDAAATAQLRSAKTDLERLDVLARMRSELGLPRRIVHLEKGDQTLLIDLESRWDVAAWLDIAKERMTITEAFPDGRSAVHAEVGRYHHELVVPFVTDPVQVEAQPRPRRLRQEGMRAVIDRVIPGDDVLFLRVSGDKGELLSVVDEIASQVIVELVADGSITHWFFLPYSDPRPHIRIRMFGAPLALYGVGLSRIRSLLAPLAIQRRIDDVRIDTYDREIYRYGGVRGLVLCEHAFCVSSEYALEFHRGVDIEADALEAVLGPCVNSMRAILEASALSIERRIGVAKRAAARYSAGQDAISPEEQAAHVAGGLYRKLKGELRDATRPRRELGESRVARLRKILATLTSEIDAGTVDESLDSLLIDLLHVHAVRLLTTWSTTQRVEEVAYHILLRALVTESVLENPKT